MLIAGVVFLYAGYPPVTGGLYAFIGLGVIIAVGGLLGIVFPDRPQSQTGNESME